MIKMTNKRREFALTTSDNPWNPITHFDEWFAFDEFFGYHTCSYLARMAHTSPILSDDMNDDIIEDAMDDIVAFDLLGRLSDGKIHYMKVVK